MALIRKKAYFRTTFHIVSHHGKVKKIPLNDGGEDSVRFRNSKKHCFLAAAILLFIGKIIITW